MRGQFMKGVVVGSLVAAVVMMAGSAFAGSGMGAVFNLGKKNKIDHATSLTGKASSKMLSVTNNGSGSALGLTVQQGKAPLTVNSTGKVSNLNADRIDGLHAEDVAANTASTYLPGGHCAFPVTALTQLYAVPGFGVVEASPEGDGSVWLRATSAFQTLKRDYVVGDRFLLASSMDSRTSGSIGRLDMLWNDTATISIFTMAGQTSSGAPVAASQALVQ